MRHLSFVKSLRGEKKNLFCFIQLFVLLHILSQFDLCVCMRVCDGWVYTCVCVCVLEGVNEPDKYTIQKK